MPCIAGHGGIGRGPGGLFGGAGIDSWRHRLDGCVARGAVHVAAAHQTWARLTVRVSSISLPSVTHAGLLRRKALEMVKLRDDFRSARIAQMLGQ